MYDAEDSNDLELKKIREKKLKALLKRSEQPPPPPEAPTVLTDSTLPNFVGTHKFAIVDCWADWCGPCRMLSPIIEKLAGEFSGRVAFGKLNVDENPQASLKYHVMSIPTLLVFRGGRLVERIVGLHPYPVLKNKITNLIRK